MANSETAVREAQAALQKAIAAARADGYRVTWQVNGSGEHSVVVDGGPEPMKAVSASPAPVPATFGGGRAFATPAPDEVHATTDD